MTPITQEEPTIITPAAESGTKPFVPTAKKAHIPAGMEKLIFVLVGLVAVVVVLAAVFSHKMDPKAKKQSRNTASTQAQQQQAAASAPAGAVMPADRNNVLNAAPDTDSDNISPADVFNTKNPVVEQQRQAEEEAAREAAKQAAAGQGTAAAQSNNSLASALGVSRSYSGVSPRPLSTIPAFHPPPYNAGATTAATTGTPGQPLPSGGAQAPQYQNGSSYGEAMQAWKEEVTKPRILFVRKATPPEANAMKYLGPAITNFGLRTGFHVAARLEASASTAVKAPVTAVIEYNYERDGQVVLPAGSRAVGQIESADIHGYMTIVFDSVDLPNGATVPIKAVAVDTNLRELKGRVTGNNKALEMFVATISGIGQTTAMALGNTSSALNEGDLMRAQLSQNMGQTADTQIQSLISNQKIVVTLAAGTEFYMVFAKPALPSQQGAAGTSSHTQYTPPTSTAGL